MGKGNKKKSKGGSPHKPVKTIKDLIHLNSNHRDDIDIDYAKLAVIIPSLANLDNVIGMERIKQLMVNQIIYFLQDFQLTN